MLANARKLLLTVGFVASLLLSVTAVGQASADTSADQAAATMVATMVATQDVGVQGGCDLTGCGTVVNGTGRGFYVTLLWGAPWSSDIVKWVNPGQTYGGCRSGTCIDVDGILVAEGCYMVGVINGRVPGYNYPFFWTSGWHKIWTNETAVVSQYTC